MPDDAPEQRDTSSRHAAVPPGRIMHDPRGQIVAVLALLCTLGAIGWVDHLTGPDIAFSLFYLIPVAAAGWSLGRFPAVATAIGAGVVWFLADLTSRASLDLGILIWNNFTRSGLLAAVGVLTAVVRGDRENLRALNLRLSQLLTHEAALARTDPLTGLRNRRAFNDALAAAARQRRTHAPLALAYVDLDNFENVNDTYGHSAGDALLERVADALREVTRANDTVGRLGGDEFAFLIEGADAQFVERVAERFMKRMSSIARECEGCGLGGSVGIVVDGQGQTDPDQLIAIADETMYRVKTAGKGRVLVHRMPDSPPSPS